MAYPGFQRGGCLRSGPIRKVGGSPLQVRYTKSGGGGGGGGGGGQFASGPIRKVGGGRGASPLQVRYLRLAHRKYLHVPTYRTT